MPMARFAASLSLSGACSRKLASHVQAYVCDVNGYAALHDEQYFEDAANFICDMMRGDRSDENNQ